MSGLAGEHCTSGLIKLIAILERKTAQSEREEGGKKTRR